MSLRRTSAGARSTSGGPHSTLATCTAGRSARLDQAEDWEAWEAAEWFAVTDELVRRRVAALQECVDHLQVDDPVVLVEGVHGHDERGFGDVGHVDAGQDLP